MAMLHKIGRLFTIKTRFEAWLVIYAIALGAVERGQHYLQAYPGWGGWMLAIACTGVVFIAGGKLLDAVRPAQPAIAGGKLLDSVKPAAPALVAGPYRAPARRRMVIDSRPRRLPLGRDSKSPISRRRD